MKHTMYFFTLFFLLSFLSGCVKTPLYKKRPLNTLTVRADSTTIKNDISVQVKKMTKKEALSFFGPRGRWLFKQRKPFYPLHISVYNNSLSTICFDPDDIHLKCLTYQEVSHRLHTKTTARTLVNLTLGCIGVGMIATVPLVYTLCTATACPTCAVMSVASTSGVIAGIGSLVTLGNTTLYARTLSSINKKISDDLYNKMITGHTYIAPGEQFNTLIFVERKHLKKNFTIFFETEDEDEFIISAPVQLQK